MVSFATRRLYSEEPTFIVMRRFGPEPDLYYIRNAQLPATGQWLRKLASTVNE